MPTQNTNLDNLFGKPTSVKSTGRGLESNAFDDGCVVVGAYEPTNIDNMESEMFTHKQRKQNIRNTCGKPGGLYFDVYASQYRRHPFLCKDPNCDNCINVYINKMLFPIKRLLHDGQAIFFYHFTAEQNATNLLRSAGKDAYRRVKQTDGSVYILTDDSVTFSDLALEIITTPEELDQHTWIEIIRNRDGNVSGNLGKLDVVELENADAVEFTYVRYTSLVFRTNQDGTETYIPSNAEVTQVESEVIMETLDLDPHTTEELIEALQTRSEIAAKKWQALGYKVQIVPQKITMKLCLYDIQWGKYNKHIEQIQQTFIEFPEILNCYAETA